jgi:hypothetical protein
LSKIENKTEKQNMLAGELYRPDAELAAEVARPPVSREQALRRG